MYEQGVEVRPPSKNQFWNKCLVQVCNMCIDGFMHNLITDLHQEEIDEQVMWIQESHKEMFRLGIDEQILYHATPTTTNNWCEWLACISLVMRPPHLAVPLIKRSDPCQPHPQQLSIHYSILMWSLMFGMGTRFWTNIVCFDQIWTLVGSWNCH